MLLDPATDEEAQREGNVLLALMPSSEQVTQLEIQGMAGYHS
jgi:hypothetical protein